MHAVPIVAMFMAVAATASGGYSAAMTTALRPIAFSEIPGWPDDDKAAAFAAFRRGCVAQAEIPAKTGNLGISGRALAETCAGALALDAAPDADTARTFFEAHFVPYVFDGSPDAGFVTGYFEPELEGSLTQTERFSVPLHGPPQDLVKIDDENRPPDFDPELTYGRRTPAGFVAYPDREAIENGAENFEIPVLAFVEDHIDAYFAHIQGSIRILLADSRVIRLTYAAKSGHPYTSIGRRLVERLGIAPEEMTADRLKQWLRDNRDDGVALMRENRSYIFFRKSVGLDPELGPVGAAKVQLTPGRSLAVDRTIHTFGTPIFVSADLPDADGQLKPFRRLMIAQDTGSA
ncbi:MAG: MltA domain-containing protein, partial [Hyphomicrobiales bacterium]|nr:MltA domain-containing protein [Hyphomicrobiales bacterium]